MHTSISRSFILLAILAIGACAKQKEQCQMHYSQVPALLGLVGFTRDEVDTFVVTAYVNDGQFSTVKDSRLIALPRPDSMQGDTLRLVNGNGLVELRIGTDYIVRVPAAAREFRISGLGTDDADYTFEATTCPHGGVSYTAPSYAQIDNKLSRPISEPHEPSPIPSHRFLLVK